MNLSEASFQIVMGLVAAAISGFLGFVIRRYLDLRPYRRLARLLQPFTRSSEEVIFVYPWREEAPASILPRTSTEDMAAINNVVGSLASVGWRGPVRVRDAARAVNNTIDRKRNLVTICGPQTNDLTKEVLRRLVSKPGLDFYDFQRLKSNPKRWEIVRGRAHFPSLSYDQEAEVRASDQVVAEGKYEDVAVLAKVTNPWNADSKVLIVSGIRGFGTWGAAEYLRKHASELFALKGKPKNGNFAALVAVTYENCDLQTKVHEVIDLPS